MNYWNNNPNNYRNSRFNYDMDNFNNKGLLRASKGTQAPENNVSITDTGNKNDVSGCVAQIAQGIAEDSVSAENGLNQIKVLLEQAGIEYNITQQINNNVCLTFNVGNESYTFNICSTNMPFVHDILSAKISKVVQLLQQRQTTSDQAYKSISQICAQFGITPAFDTNSGEVSFDFCGKTYSVNLYSNLQTYGCHNPKDKYSPLYYRNFNKAGEYQGYNQNGTGRFFPHHFNSQFPPFSPANNSNGYQHNFPWNNPANNDGNNWNNTPVNNDDENPTVQNENTTPETNPKETETEVNTVAEEKVVTENETETKTETEEAEKEVVSETEPEEESEPKVEITVQPDYDNAPIETHSVEGKVIQKVFKDKNGLITKIDKYDENGQIESTIKYYRTDKYCTAFENKPNNDLVAYYSYYDVDGTKLREYHNIVNFQKVLKRLYYENGNIRSEEKFDEDNGKLIYSTHFNEDGKLDWRDDYVDGERITSTWYNEDGLADRMYYYSTDGSTIITMVSFVYDENGYTQITRDANHNIVSEQYFNTNKDIKVEQYTLSELMSKYLLTEEIINLFFSVENGYIYFLNQENIKKYLSRDDINTIEELLKAIEETELS